ncbi:MAG: hypothetical protein ABJB03_05715 [Rhodoglobus sp.]
MSAIRPGTGEVLALSDMETSIFIARRRDAVVVETADRSTQRRLQGSFATEQDAQRLVVAMIGARWRSEHGLREIVARTPAEGVAFEEGPTAIHLTWDGGSADFPRGVAGRGRALDFSRVVGASIADIASSYEHSNGHPLFEGR